MFIARFFFCVLFSLLGFFHRSSRVPSGGDEGLARLVRPGPPSPFDFITPNAALSVCRFILFIAYFATLARYTPTDAARLGEIFHLKHLLPPLPGNTRIESSQDGFVLVLPCRALQAAQIFHHFLCFPKAQNGSQYHDR